MVRCDKCGKDEYMPFRCKYCGGYYCSEHRLPEMHDCSGYYGFSRSTVGQASQTPTPTGFGYASPRRSRFYFSQRELRDLAIGLAVIMCILFTGFGGRLLANPAFMVGSLLIFALAFLLHELAHKFMAQRLGYWAEFRINQQGLLITLLSFISPFKVIAPGAVMIGGVMNPNDYGWISIAGCATNIGMGILYLLTFLSTNSNLIYNLAYIGMYINSSLALFNLIPFGIFDGAKVLRWNKYVWIGAVIVAGLLFLYTTF
jgi:Zn-dependent protease